LLALIGPLLLLGPVGLAHLARNAVPVTRAGQMVLTVDPQLALTATPALVDRGSSGLLSTDDLSARLTSSGSPVGGASIVFVVAGREVCTSVTDAAGVATCDFAAAGFVQRPPTYSALYAGASGVPPVRISAALKWEDA
jgi:hypothetical protein